MADLGYDRPVVLRFGQPPGSHVRTDVADDPVEDSQAAEDREDDVPDPQQQVDLLVDNVQWQHAHSVVVLSTEKG